MSDFFTIFRAVYSGLSQRKVAATHGVSRKMVSLYLRKARDQGWLTLKDLDALDDTTVTQGLLQITAPSRDATFKMPDFDYVHMELAKPYVTLKLLWEEYVEQCRQSNERFYIETQFRRYYCFLQGGNPQTVLPFACQGSQINHPAGAQTRILARSGLTGPAPGSPSSSMRRAKRCLRLRYS